MKKILLISMILSLTLSSCLKNDEEKFDESASARIEKAIRDYKEILMSAENGWVFEYFPHPEQAYGGYIYIVEFEDRDLVKAHFEFGEPDEVEESLWDIVNDFGAMLTFNSYNPFLHYFAQPSSDMYQGYEADYEFMILSYENNVLNLRGKKTDNHMRMTKLPSDMTPEQYLTQRAEIEDIAYYGDYLLLSDGAEIGTVERDDNRNMTFNIFDDKVPYVYTNTGIRFFEPITIYNQQIQDFRWDDASKTYIAENTILDLRLEAYQKDDYGFYNDYLGNWTLQGVFYGNGGNTTSLPVEFYEDEFERTMIMKSRNGAFEFEWTFYFNRARGYIEVFSQDLGTFDAYDVKLGVYEPETGYYYTGGLPNDGPGMKVVLDKSGSVHTGTFLDAGRDESKFIEGFVYGFYNAAGDNAGREASSQYPYIQQFEKITMTKN